MFVLQRGRHIRSTLKRSHGIARLSIARIADLDVCNPRGKRSVVARYLDLVMLDTAARLAFGLDRAAGKCSAWEALGLDSGAWTALHGIPGVGAPECHEGEDGFRDAAFALNRCVLG